MGPRIKALATADLEKFDVDQIIKGRSINIVEAKANKDCIIRKNGNPLLQNQEEVDEACAFIEKLYFDAELPVSPKHFGRIVYWLHKFYYVEYLVRIALEIFLKIFRWPYCTTHLMKALLSQMDVHLLMETFPKLIRIYHNVPMVIGYTVAAMGCVADLDARRFSDHEQLIFHTVNIGQRYLKNEMILTNVLFFIQRLCAPNTVDFFLEKKVLQNKEKLLKLPMSQTAVKEIGPEKDTNEKWAGATRAPLDINERINQTGEWAANKTVKKKPLGVKESGFQKDSAKDEQDGITAEGATAGSSNIYDSDDGSPRTRGKFNQMLNKADRVYHQNQSQVYPSGDGYACESIVSVAHFGGPQDPGSHQGSKSKLHVQSSAYNLHETFHDLYIKQYLMAVPIAGDLYRDRVQYYKVGSLSRPTRPDVEIMNDAISTGHMSRDTTDLTDNAASVKHLVTKPNFRVEFMHNVAKSFPAAVVQVVPPAPSGPPTLTLGGSSGGKSKKFVKGGDGDVGSLASGAIGAGGESDMQKIVSIPIGKNNDNDGKAGMRKPTGYKSTGERATGQVTKRTTSNENPIEDFDLGKPGENLPPPSSPTLRLAQSPTKSTEPTLSKSDLKSPESFRWDDDVAEKTFLARGEDDHGKGGDDKTAKDKSPTDGAEGEKKKGRKLEKSGHKKGDHKNLKKIEETGDKTEKADKGDKASPKKGAKDDKSSKSGKDSKEDAQVEVSKDSLKNSTDYSEALKKPNKGKKSPTDEDRGSMMKEDPEGEKDLKDAEEKVNKSQDKFDKSVSTVSGVSTTSGKKKGKKTKAAGVDSRENDANDSGNKLNKSKDEEEEGEDAGDRSASNLTATRQKSGKKGEDSKKRKTQKSSSPKKSTVDSSKQELTGTIDDAITLLPSFELGLGGDSSIAVAARGDRVDDELRDPRWDRDPRSDHSRAGTVGRQITNAGPNPIAMSRTTSIMKNSRMRPAADGSNSSVYGCAGVSDAPGSYQSGTNNTILDALQSESVTAEEKAWITIRNDMERMEWLERNQEMIFDGKSYVQRAYFARMRDTFMKNQVLLVGGGCFHLVFQLMHQLSTPLIAKRLPVAKQLIKDDVIDEGMNPAGTNVNPDDLKTDLSAREANLGRAELEGGEVTESGTLIRQDDTQVRVDGTTIEPDGTVIKPDARAPIYNVDAHNTTIDANATVLGSVDELVDEEDDVKTDANKTVGGKSEGKSDGKSDGKIDLKSAKEGKGAKDGKDKDSDPHAITVITTGFVVNNTNSNDEPIPIGRTPKTEPKKSALRSLNLKKQATFGEAEDADKIGEKDGGKQIAVGKQATVEKQKSGLKKPKEKRATRSIRTVEMEKENKDSDVLLLALHAVYLMIRGNPHNLRRFCRADDWTARKAGMQHLKAKSKKAVMMTPNDLNNLSAKGALATRKSQSFKGALSASMHQQSSSMLGSPEDDDDDPGVSGMGASGFGGGRKSGHGMKKGGSSMQMGGMSMAMSRVEGGIYDTFAGPDDPIFGEMGNDGGVTDLEARENVARNIRLNGYPGGLKARAYFEENKKKGLCRINCVASAQRASVTLFMKLLRGRCARDRQDLTIIILRLIKLVVQYWSEGGRGGKPEEVGPWLELVAPIQESIATFHEVIEVQLEGGLALGHIVALPRKGQQVTKNAKKTVTTEEEELENGLGLKVPIITNVKNTLEKGVKYTLDLIEAQARLGDKGDNAVKQSSSMTCFSPRLLKQAQKTIKHCDYMLVESIQEKDKARQKMFAKLVKMKGSVFEDDNYARQESLRLEFASKYGNLFADDVDILSLARKAEKKIEQKEREKQELEKAQAAGYNTIEEMHQAQEKTAAEQAAAAEAAKALEAAEGHGRNAKIRGIDDVSEEWKRAGSEVNLAATTEEQRTMAGGELVIAEKESQILQKGDPGGSGAAGFVTSGGVDGTGSINIQGGSGNSVIESMIDPQEQARLMLRDAEGYTATLGDPDVSGDKAFELFLPSMKRSMMILNEISNREPIIRVKKQNNRALRVKVYYLSGYNELMERYVSLFASESNKAKITQSYCRDLVRSGYNLPRNGLDVSIVGHAKNSTHIEKDSEEEEDLRRKEAFLENFATLEEAMYEDWKHRDDEIAHDMEEGSLDFDSITQYASTKFDKSLEAHNMKSIRKIMKGKSKKKLDTACSESELESLGSGNSGGSKQLEILGSAGMEDHYVPSNSVRVEKRKEKRLEDHNILKRKPEIGGPLGATKMMGARLRGNFMHPDDIQEMEKERQRSKDPSTAPKSLAAVAGEINARAGSKRVGGELMSSSSKNIPASRNASKNPVAASSRVGSPLDSPHGEKSPNKQLSKQVAPTKVQVVGTDGMASSKRFGGDGEPSSGGKDLSVFGSKRLDGDASPSPSPRGKKDDGITSDKSKSQSIGTPLTSLKKGDMASPSTSLKKGAEDPNKSSGKKSGVPKLPAI